MIKHKFIIIFGTIVLIMMMFGCPNEQSINQVSAAEISNSKTAYLTIGVNESSRTALPYTDVESFERFVLTGRTTGNIAGVSVDLTWDGDGTTDAYTKLTTANIAVTAGAKYSFTLTAFKSGASWSDTKEITISTGTDNHISFNLSFASLSANCTGVGFITVTLTVPDRVATADAVLKKSDGTTISVTSAGLQFNGSKATYDASNIPSGNYVLVFTLWGDTDKKLKLGEWREYVCVASGLRSISLPSIDNSADLDSIYTITFDTNGGDFVENTTFSLSYTRHSDVSLPTAANISRTGYTFDGWSVVGGNSDETIDGWTKNTRTGNISLQAKWTANRYAVGLFYSDTSGDCVDATYDQNLPSVTVPIKTGYTFGGYYLDDTNDENMKYIDATGDGCKKWDVTDDEVLIAKWTATIYTIEYRNTNGGSYINNNTNPTTYTIEDDVVLWGLQRTGYEPNAWLEVIGDTTTDNEINMWEKGERTGNLIVWAKWTPKWDTDSTGNFVLGDRVFQKTGLKKVMESNVEIYGSNSAGGVFVTGRKVTLSPYSIGKFEVTQELYEAVMGKSQSEIIAGIADAADYGISNYNPIYYVSWYDAIVFCNKLTSKIWGDNARCYKLKDGTYPDAENNISSMPTTEGADQVSENWREMTCDFNASGYRLPTECEWEFAARGGNPSDQTNWNYTYSGSDNSVDVAWYDGDSSGHTWEVGLKTENGCDICDMTGNVWEWCWDYFDSIGNNTPVIGSTTIPSNLHHLLRGGSYLSSDADSLLKVFKRHSNTPNDRYQDHGFRIACTEGPWSSSSEQVSNYVATGSGNFVINGVECLKTGMTTVNGGTINGSGTAGVFVTGRNVTLSPYSIGKFEVTQELFNAVMGENPSAFKTTDPYSNGIVTETNVLLRPVDKVNWYDAITFCNKLSHKMDKTPCYTVQGVDFTNILYGQIPNSVDSTADWNNVTVNMNANGYRLPIECEWEFAARGGNPSDSTNWNYTRSGSNDADVVAWYAGNSSGHPWEVGLKNANDCGIFDMTGNVWEWCWDRYNSSVMIGDVLGASTGDSRMTLGGCYNDNDTTCTLPNRSSTICYKRNNGVGFRIACTEGTWASSSENTNYVATGIGNFVIGGVECLKTGMKTVLSSSVTIPCTDNTWDSQFSSISGDMGERLKGAFIGQSSDLTLSPYSIGQYEVTQQLYEAVMQANKNYDKGNGNTYPVYYVSWYDAITFCNKLSWLMGKTPCYSVGDSNLVALEYADIPSGNSNDWNSVSVNMDANGYRLPTEAEWEFAARGGDTTKPDWYYAFSGIDSTGSIYLNGVFLKSDENLATVGWYSDNSSDTTHLVGQKSYNRLNLFDMSGNVWEWCWDKKFDTSRWVRGGSFEADATGCYVLFRGDNANIERVARLGFRIVCNGAVD